jgi:uncharacterized iron-regulated membrane protein
MRMRQRLVLCHRYVGLAVAVFLSVAGVTGALLAFRTEIDHWLNADLYDRRFPGLELSVLELRDKVLAQYPQAWIDHIALDKKPAHAARFFLSPRPAPVTGQPLPLDVMSVEVNPVTGTVIEEWRSTDSMWSRRNLMSTLVSLHYELLIRPYDIGIWIMGLAALFWFLDHFVALLISFPSRKTWRKSFQIRFGAGGYRLIFDLHRSGGVWLWLLLGVFALTSVDYNLGDTVYDLWCRCFHLSPPRRKHYGRRVHRHRNTQDWIGPRHSHAPTNWCTLGRHRTTLPSTGSNTSVLIVTLASIACSFTPVKTFATSTTAVAVRSCSSMPIPGATSAWEWPLGNSAGDAFLAWLPPLHVGAIWGLPHRIVLCVLGVMTATLSVTGVMLWSRKRRAKRLHRRRVTRVQ